VSVAIAAMLAALAFVCCSRNAGAVPAGGPVTSQTAGSPSLTMQTFYGRSTRHHVVKCYRQLVVGPYVCRRYYRL